MDTNILNLHQWIRTSKKHLIYPDLPSPSSLHHWKFQQQYQIICRILLFDLFFHIMLERLLYHMLRVRLLLKTSALCFLGTLLCDITNSSSFTFFFNVDAVNTYCPETMHYTMLMILPSLPISSIITGLSTNCKINVRIVRIKVFEFTLSL
jgi:hypothetical protein